MRLWIDDIRPAPEGYIWVKSVNEAKNIIESYIRFMKHLMRTDDYDGRVLTQVFNLCMQSDLIDIDHDAGDYANDGGDYINLLNWLEFMKYAFPIHIHSQNIVGVENMRRIIRRNGWKEV